MKADPNADQILMVTGHRRLDHRDAVLAALGRVIDVVRPVLAIAGGASGADDLFAGVATRAQVPLWIIYPNIWYRRRYRIVDRHPSFALRISYAVERPMVCPDWRNRWNDEQWWKDNFVRNGEMVGRSTIAVVVSDRSPLELVEEERGGTVQCVKALQRGGHEHVLWVPDEPEAKVRPVRWVA
jgi:hypothetical protein